MLAGGSITTKPPGKPLYIKIFILYLSVVDLQRCVSFRSIAKWLVIYVHISSVQLLSHARLCNPMDRSTPGLPVLHQLPELAQTHVHRVGDAIQPSHPLSSPSPAFNLSQHRVFSNKSVLHIRWPKYWSFSFSISPSNKYSGLISFRWTALISLQSKGLSRVFSITTVQKHPFFGTQLSL